MPTYQNNLPAKGTNNYNINELVNLYTKSMTRERIPVIGLIERYRPETTSEMRDIINRYSPCTVHDCAQHAFENQQNYNCSYSYEQLYSYVDDLAVNKVTLGRRKEIQALKFFQDNIQDAIFEHADYDTDSLYAVDIIVKDKVGKIVAGVQVKSNGFRAGKHQSTIEAMRYARERNEKFSQLNGGGIPVFYFYYDITFKFMEVDKMLSGIINVLSR